MTGLAMVTLVVNEYDEAIDYFVSTVGFLLIEDTPLSPEKRWVVLQTGQTGARLLLARAASDSQSRAVGNQTGGRVGFFLHTLTFDSDYARMRDAGVTFIESPRTEAYGRVVVFEDLYGNRWDLVEVTA